MVWAGKLMNSSCFCYVANRERMALNFRHNIKFEALAAQYRQQCGLIKGNYVKSLFLFSKEWVRLYLMYLVIVQGKLTWLASCQRVLDWLER